MKQKVCHLTSVHPPFDLRIFYKQCISLKNEGYQVHLIAPVENEITKQGIKVIPIYVSNNRLIRMLFTSFKMSIKALKTKSSVFHFHDPELMLCGIILKCAGKKVIFDVHENVRLSIKSKDWIPGIIKKPLALVYYLFERFAILFFDALVLAEESYLKYYPERKSTVVLNYPILDNKATINRDFTQPIRFIYAGGVSENRGVWEMVKLIEKLLENGVNCYLTIVGSIYNIQLKEELYLYLEKKNIKKFISIIGRVDFSEVEEFYGNADIGLVFLKPIPNYMESLPTKMFEYMQFGLPFFISNFPLYKKYVNESRSGFCVDVDALDQHVDELIKILVDNEQLMEMSLCGIQAIKQKYNWNTEQQKLIELYRKILD